MLTIYFLGGGGSSAIVSVGVFYVWPKTTRLLPMWPREAKRLDTPGLKPFQYKVKATNYVDPNFALV
jgi:hypothetical protein